MDDRRRLTLRLVRMATAGLAVVLAIAAGLPALARADGDPGSDVLVYQDLFAGSDAGLRVQQQLQLEAVLKTAAREGFPIRVAIIAGPVDLGAVTALWHNPRGYARFLGTELSLVYTQRLLVVMPNGFGFNWPGHSTTSAYGVLAGTPTGSGRGGLFDATLAALRRLATADGIELPASTGTPRHHAPTAAATKTANTVAPTSSNATEQVLGIMVLGSIAIAAIIFGIRRASSRRRWRRPRMPAGWHLRLATPAGVLILASTLGLAAFAIAAFVVRPGQSAPSRAANPHLDPGTPIHGAAPNFTLSDQFGQPVSLSSFRGKVVILAFNDSECTTVCPLTTTAMMDAKAMLGSAGSRVQLLGVDANPVATSVEDVWSYSELHGMLHAWRFLTGSLSQLRQVWKDYGIQAAIQHGEITHTPALFVVDPRGRLSRLYMTQMSYTAVPQEGELLAQSASALLPSRPAVHADPPHTQLQPTTPRTQASLPRAGGGIVRFGPGRAARLFVFFATWDQETSALAGELDRLNRYQKLAGRTGLPQLTAVDEASVEPGATRLIGFLHRLPKRLSYPVAIDQTGTIADGYQVVGLPWFVLTSANGHILYYRTVSTAGWPSTNELARHVRSALARAPKLPRAVATAPQLSGSPAPLAALHGQAGQLLGSARALAARLRALRGYPVVINAWASWCGPCESEFSLFASASEHYGRHVAFLGADTNDSPGDARTFLAEHPVSYPSYQTTTTDLSSLAEIEGLPTTIFLNPAGKVTYVHIGQYDTQATLEQDISRYAQPSSNG